MNAIWFVAFPYLAVILAIGVGLYRFLARRFTYSSLSSELLENRKLYWGSVTWHYGIIPILLAHIFGWLFPGIAATILANPVRLFILEAIGLALGLYAALGVLVLIWRRLPNAARARAVTSAMDWIVLIVLAIQVVSGVGIALFLRWGSRWYLSTAVPWLWSLVTLRPDPDLVSSLPALAQIHLVCGFLFILLFPFSRLVHLIVFPVYYLWRPYQVVIWNHDPRAPQVPPPPTLVQLARSTHAPAPRANLPAAEPEEVKRRQLLSRLGVMVAGGVGLIVAVPSLAFLLGLRRSVNVWRDVGGIDQFQVGQTVEVAFLDPSPLPWSGVTARTAAWLRRKGDTDFVVFSMHCTHLGCPVRWLPDADLFMCPCHGGVFYNDGRVASGPPPRPLVKYPVRVRNGRVEILTSPVPIVTV
jgi:nitrate reductase gamma subunit